ncbi:MAG: ABC transporter substrate-binding protein [Defluviitaleaceae bacterium]|nr:ABC transporter substrate-binding protein [Defluviitaleaceae bacterium]
MKKIFKLLVVVMVALFVVACGGSGDADLTGGHVRIATPRGPAALGMLELMEEGTRNDYTFTIVGAPDEIPPMLVRGDIDIAAVPPNMASILFNNPNLDVQVLALTTMGVLHIVDTTGEIGSVADLRGRAIYASGGGGTPEFILNHILLGNGLTPGVDVTINFRPEHSEIAALIEGGLAEIAMLPEPFATTTVNRIDNLDYALDLTAEWNRISPDSGLVMTAVVARRDFIEANPDAITIFLEELEASVNFTRNNVEAAAELAVTHDIIPAAPVARLAIPRSNVTFISSNTMQTYLSSLLEVFYTQLPQSVGGSLPDASFYFIP